MAIKSKITESKPSTNMDFLKSFNKDLEKMEGISTTDAPPRWSIDSGNYVLNRITSGSFYTSGIASQGRVGILTGPAGSGKSFVAANIIREAQATGAHILVIDSENALDSVFVSAIGVDSTNDYTYIGVKSIAQVVNIVSQFLKGYKTEYSDNFADAPKVLIVIDSLDMLMTDTELDHYTSGIQKGDQGQKNRQLKSFLKTVVQDIKALNVSMIATAHCYKNQDVMNGEGVYIVADAIKFSASTVTMLTKLKLKEGTEVVGIRMKCEGYKCRLTRPFQTVVISVPYESGINKCSGLVPVLLSLDIIEKAGARYKIKGEDVSWFEKDIEQHVDKLLKLAESKNKTFVAVFDPKAENVDE